MKAISCHHFGRRTARARAGSRARLRRAGTALLTCAPPLEPSRCRCPVCQRRTGRTLLFDGEGLVRPPRTRPRGAVMARRRVGGAALAAGALVLAALAAPSFGSGGSPVKFGKPPHVA